MWNLWLFLQREQSAYHGVSISAEGVDWTAVLPEAKASARPALDAWRHQVQAAHAYDIALIGYRWEHPASSLGSRPCIAIWAHILGVLAWVNHGLVSVVMATVRPISQPPPTMWRPPRAYSLGKQVQLPYLLQVYWSARVHCLLPASRLRQFRKNASAAELAALPGQHLDACLLKHCNCIVISTGRTSFLCSWAFWPFLMLSLYAPQCDLSCKITDAWICFLRPHTSVA